MSIKKTDILIVGAGPVGMSLAILLKKAKVDFILLDKREAVTKLPRAIAINQASLSLFNELGIFENLKKYAVCINEAQIFWNKKHIGAINFHNVETKYPYFLHVSQDIVEQELENLLINNQIPIDRGHEFLESSSNSGAVLSNIKAKNDTYKIQSKYIVATDGGNSTVRKQFENNLNEESYGSYFILFDIEVFDPIFDRTRYYFAQDGYCMIIPKNNCEYRVIFSSEFDPKELLHGNNKEDFLKQYLINKAGLVFNLKSIKWHVYAKFGHKVSNMIADEHHILAGDALHQFSPIGGTNMNFGLQDAVILGGLLPNILKYNDVNLIMTQYINPRKIQINRQIVMTRKLTKLLTTKQSSFSEYKSIYKMLKSQQIASFLTGNNNVNF